MTTTSRVVERRVVVEKGQDERLRPTIDHDMVITRTPSIHTKASTSKPTRAMHHKTRNLYRFGMTSENYFRH